ncbi:uncharacterized protein [Dysidea avara]
MQLILIMLSVIFIISVILTKELVMATEQCREYQFKSPFYPGESCEEIYNKNPESHDKSGYYWILDGPRKVYCGMNYTGSSCLNIYNGNPETADKSGYYRINAGTQWTFCNMTEIVAGFISTCAGVGGGWRRIANIDISTGGDCPSGWRKDTYSGVSFCRVVNDFDHTCSSTTFSTNGTSYQRVCGRTRGYQKGASVAFWAYHNRNQSLNGYYVDGLSITHGNPRQHIWTYANGLYDGLADDNDQYNCPCAPGSEFSPSPFVGTNYYCESGGINTLNLSAYYFNDPLWDGSGCITSNCCDNPTQPWFYREFSGTTTDDIEARICREAGFSFGSTLIDQLELYIQ